MTNVEDPAVSEPPAKKHKIFSYMEEDREAHDQSRSRSTDQKLELQKYLENLPTSVLEATFLSIPASSAPVERLFTS